MYVNFICVSILGQNNVNLAKGGEDMRLINDCIDLLNLLVVFNDF